jgi:hypothetical protein
MGELRQLLFIENIFISLCAPGPVLYASLIKGRKAENLPDGIRTLVLQLSKKKKKKKKSLKRSVFMRRGNPSEDRPPDCDERDGRLGE